MLRVVIVEDDPMVARINRDYVEMDRRFCVVEEFRDGTSALAYLEKNDVQLVILDMYMPGCSGLELLKELRGRGLAVDVIMITAANDAKTVDSIMKLGVIDYLVKPFVYPRFKQALDKFFAHYRSFVNAGRFNQDELDRLFSASSEVFPAARKGLQDKTLAHIRAYLKGSADTGYTSEEIADSVGLSRVTVRRYMNYLLETGEFISSINYETGGRPCMVYRCRPLE